MGYLERRDRARIYAEILESINRASTESDKVRVTRVQGEVNVPFVRFKEYINDLRSKAMIEIEPSLKLTEKGSKYLVEYKRVREFLERFGFAKASSDRAKYGRIAE